MRVVCGTMLLFARTSIEGEAVAEVNIAFVDAVSVVGFERVTVVDAVGILDTARGLGFRGTLQLDALAGNAQFVLVALGVAFGAAAIPPWLLSPAELTYPIGLLAVTIPRMSAGATCWPCHEHTPPKALAKPRQIK